jgi:hypothetical protein
MAGRKGQKGAQYIVIKIDPQKTKPKLAGTSFSAIRGLQKAEMTIIARPLLAIGGVQVWQNPNKTSGLGIPNMAATQKAITEVVNAIEMAFDTFRQGRLSVSRR